MSCKEFSIINKYFNHQKSSRVGVEIGIGDDCALLHPRENEVLAISTDTLVCGRHFPPNFDPANLANKALLVNISDIAAMGAYPAWITLSLTLPSKVNESWIESFSKALFMQLNYYDIQLIGGDTTAGPLSITITIFGFVPKGFSLKRSGASPGEWIYVTGTLGDSAAGLAILQNRLKIKDIDDTEYLINRHTKPTPRILHGRILLQYASSAIDLSDGLLSDIKHILKASRVGAQIEVDTFPLSFAMRKHVDKEQAIRWVLTGGEDYELLFTVPEQLRHTLEMTLSYLSTPFTRIGKTLTEDKGLNFIQNGKKELYDWKVYEHFA